MTDVTDKLRDVLSKNEAPIPLREQLQAAAAVTARNVVAAEMDAWNSSREARARELIEGIAELSAKQHVESTRLIDCKARREAVKLQILVEGSREDPKALGANEALRAAEVQRLYVEQYDGEQHDEAIRDIERETAERQIEIDRCRRLLRLEMALLNQHTEEPL